jgi:Tetratricopeptide repeat
VEWARVQFAIAYVLYDQGQYSEEERIFREVLKERERVLGPEHPDTLQTCFNLTGCLRAESKMKEAKAFAKRAAEGALRVLGPENPDTKKYEQVWQELESTEGQVR